MSSQALLKAHVSAVKEVVDDVRPLDLVHLSRQTLGDRSLENELLSLFDRQAQHLTAQLEALAGSAERGLRRDLAHTIKGSARAVGALKVALYAQEYEDLVVSGSEACIAPACSDLSAAVTEVRSAIAELLADR
jgi:HPt (histidine-containing phosphotransfer) domain-containing protein